MDQRHTVLTQLFSGAVLLLMLAIAAPVHAQSRAILTQDTVKLARTIPYASAAVGTPAIHNECDWNTALSQYIVTYSNGLAEAADEPLPKTAGKTLTIAITGVRAIGGGRWTGQKWARIHGELREGGRVVGSFEAERRTLRRFTGCGALALLAQAMGRDVAIWLKQPTMNARLGNAR